MGGRALRGLRAAAIYTPIRKYASIFTNGGAFLVVPAGY